MPLVLQAAEVAPLLDLPKAIELTEDALREQARGSAGLHAPYHLDVPAGALRVVSGALIESEWMGVRVGPAMGLTPPTGARNHIAVLYDTEGELRALVGYPFGTLRTGATVAAAVRHMASAEARTVGMLGTGRNALSLLRGVQHVRPVSEVRVYSRDADRRSRFAADAEKELGIAAHAVDDARNAVSGMDIVLTASNQRQPILDADWLSPGTHLNSMGPIAELSPETLLKADRLVVGSRVQERDYYIRTPPFPLVELIEAGKLSWDDVAELGEVIEGKVQSGTGPDEITVFHESQGGIGDLVFAAWVYEEAVRRGLGQEVAL